MTYFVIHNSDGDTSVEVLDKKQLIDRLNDNEYYGPIGFLDKIDDPDTDYWGDNLLIIKGEIVVPKSKTVIKEFVID